MRLKKSLIILSIGAGFLYALGVASYQNFSAASIQNSAFSKPADQISPPIPQASSAFPIRLKIPKINVDAAITYVGLTPQGAMDVPKGPADVAWFRLGPHPGDIGSAVMAGHFGPWKNGGGSVFDNLNKLTKGDLISVEDDKGATATFVVSGSRLYSKTANASDVFRSNDGRAHLNIITCEGVWDKTKKTYSDRLVVFADKE